MPAIFGLTFACRLRNRFFAFLAQIREMVFHAGLDTAAPRHNIRTVLFEVPCTSLPDGSLLYQRKLARQRKLFEVNLDARPTDIAGPRAPLKVGSTGFKDSAYEVILRAHHRRYCANREKRHSHDSDETKRGSCAHVNIPLRWKRILVHRARDPHARSWRPVCSRPNQFGGLHSYKAQAPPCHRTHLRTARRVWRMVVLATHTPFTIVLPGPQPTATCVIMLSGCGIGADVMACANVAMDKAKPAAAINLII